MGGVVNVARVNADQERSLTQRYGIQGFPTLKIFAQGSNPEDYMGSRSAKSIVDHLMYKFRGISDPTVSVKHLEDLQQFIGEKSDLPRAVLFTAKPSNPDLFKSLALDFDNDKEMRFAFVGNADTKSDVMSAADVSEPRTLIVIPAGETNLSDRVLYSGALKKSDMLKFLKGFVSTTSTNGSGSTNSGTSSSSSGDAPESSSSKKKTGVKKSDVVEQIDSQEKLQEACARLCVLAVAQDDTSDQSKLALFRSLALEYGSSKDATIRFGTLLKADISTLDKSLKATYDDEKEDDHKDVLDVVVIRQNRKRYLRKHVTKDNAHELIDRLLDGFAGLNFKPMPDGNLPTLFHTADDKGGKPKDEL